ncbi:hypothetical protein G4G93_07550 [Methylobacterium sp. DB0501]|nr:hypothetical protein [Methylobacterium sp. DB0501]
MTEAEMAKHIAEGIENRMAIDAAPDRTAKLAEIIARGDLVWAVWPETDKRKPKIAGHALALLKGRPILKYMSDNKSSGYLEQITIMLNSHSSACGACGLYGDEAEPKAS